jgi:hypothetical protein
MAVTECPECHHQIAKAARFCPECGSEISGTYKSQTVTTQHTSKPLKAQLLISVSLFWFGLLSWFLPHGHSSEVLGISWATAATILGGVWYVRTKGMLWWEHG